MVTKTKLIWKRIWQTKQVPEIKRTIPIQKLKLANKREMQIKVGKIDNKRGKIESHNKMCKKHQGLDTPGK